MTKNNLRAEALRKNRNNDGRPKLALTEKKGYKVTVKFATAEYYSLKSKTKEVVFLFVSMGLVVLVLCSALYFATPSQLRQSEAEKLNHEAEKLKKR